MLWAFSDNEKHPLHIQKILKNSDNTFYVSSVSVWEIAIKKSLGKLECPDNLIEMIFKKQCKQLEINFFHAQKVESLPNIHNDPFDRFLIAQSQVENIPILTKDQYIREYDVEVIWD